MRSLTFAAILCVGVPVTAGGQVPEKGDDQAVEHTEAKSLTLSELDRLAFQHNPTLARAAVQVRAARGRRVQAGLYPNPVVGYHATEIGNRATSGQQGGFISQRFVTAGKLGLDQAIARKQFDESHFRFHGQEQRVLSDVRVRFFEALVGQKKVELTVGLARIGDELVVATQKLVDSGLGAENDLLQAQIRADESHILRDNARNSLDEAWRRLAAVVGLQRMERVPLSGELVDDLAVLDWDQCYAQVLVGNPELSAAQARLDRALVVVRRAKKEPIPNIDVSLSFRHNNITGSDNANIQVGVPVPIFDRNQGNISAAEADWVAAKKDVERIQLHLQDKLAVAYRRYANARQQAERYGKRMVPRAKKSLRLVTEGYKKGQIQYLTLLNAQQTYLQVNLSYLDSLRELRTSQAVIDGQLMTGSLSRK